MTWSATDDGAESNPRVMRLELGTFMRDALGFGDPYLQRMVAWGALELLASWSGKHFTDLHFPEVMVRRVAGPHVEWIVKACQSAGLLSKKKVKGKDGDLGWQFVDSGDQLINVLTREQVDANKKKGVRNGDEVAARLRDGDECRYCGRLTSFLKRSGWWRGTYLPAHREHPDPADRSQIVVACGRCNQLKGEQTPEEWGRPLLPIPDEPIYNDDTLDLFKRHHIHDIPAERARVLADYGTGAGTGARTSTALDAAPATDRGVPIPATTGQGWSGQQSGLAGAGQNVTPFRVKPGAPAGPPLEAG